MAENSGIEWTDNTFNPWIGCTKVSPACQNCYAERDFDHRYGKVQWGPRGTRVRTSPANWRKPITWNRQAEESGTRIRVFCASLADVFEDWQGPIMSSGASPVILGVDGRAAHTGNPRMTMDDCRRDLFNLIDATPHLDWLLLTKRPENVDLMWDDRNRRNVWLGMSIEDQAWTDKRMPHLLRAKRCGWVNTIFVSAEPLVGPIVIPSIEHVDWVITGGESGPNARPAEPDWYRSLRDQCEKSGTPFHFKQWGEWIPYEDGPVPLIESQHGDTVDRHTLPDGLTEHEPVDGWWWPNGLSSTIFRHVGKKKAGRLLDGRTHDGVPVTVSG